MSKKVLAAALKEYRRVQKREQKTLQRLANEAENSGDYDDYDQACYSSWEYMEEQGAYLAAAIEEYLK